jgi:hypothetical protein
MNYWYLRTNVHPFGGAFPKSADAGVFRIFAGISPCFIVSNFKEVPESVTDREGEKLGKVRPPSPTTVSVKIVNV